MTAAEAFDRIAAAALLGVRGDVGDVGAPERIAALGSGRSGAEGVLAMAAGLSQFARAGGLARQSGAERVDGPPAERATVAGPGAAAGLRRALETDELLPECLHHLAARDMVAPAAMLPSLLELGVKTPRLAGLVAPVLGERGRWLAGLGPRWRQAQAPAAPDPAVAARRWQTGERAERLWALTPLRAADPAAARALVESTWEEDNPEERAVFLRRLKTGLSANDEPLLERALGDRRKPVREVAADLLARLPESAYVARMTARALTSVGRGTGRKLKIQVELPEEDAALKREAPATAPRAGQGDRARLLEAIVSVPPPAVWQERLGASPAEIIAAIDASDWAQPLLCGIATAAHRHEDVAWADALVRAQAKLSKGIDVAILAELASLLSQRGRTGAVAGAVKASRDADWTALLLNALEAPWSDEVSGAAADAIRSALSKAKRNRIYRDSPLWIISRVAACSAAAHCLPTIRGSIEPIADDSPAFADILSLLDQRERMLEELNRDD